MPKQSRIDKPGVLHHIICHGAEIENVPIRSQQSNIAEFVNQNFNIMANSKSVSDKPAIFYSPGGTGILGQTPHTIIVYTVTDKIEQDKIIELISDYRTKKNLRHIRIQFYREENWRSWINKDSRQCSERLKEELIRTERL